MDIPETVAVAQPVLYLFAFTMLGIVAAFLVTLRYMMDKFTKTQEQIVERLSGEIMGKLNEIDNKIDAQPRRRRGLIS